MDKIVKAEAAIYALHFNLFTGRASADDLTVSEYDALWDNAHAALTQVQPSPDANKETKV